MQVSDFDAEYLPGGRAVFAANIHFQGWRRAEHRHLAAVPSSYEVNHPLRIGGNRVYLQGHGYAPTFTVTFPDGRTRTTTVQWRPDDPLTLLSSGVIRVDPPGAPIPTPTSVTKHQIAVQVFAPTERLDGTLLSLQFPALNDPAVAIDIYRGERRAGHRAPAVAVHPRPAADQTGPG